VTENDATTPTEPTVADPAPDESTEAPEVPAQVDDPSTTGPAEEVPVVTSGSAPEPAVTAEQVAALEPAAELEPLASTVPDAEPTPEPDAGATAEPEPAATPRPAPGPRPIPRPIPRAVPRPPSITPASIPPARSTTATGGPAGAVPAPSDAAEAALAATFGRVDDDGTVYVREGAAERAVGQFPGASSEEALALYVRRFLDLQAKVVVFETRLAATDLAVKEIDQTLAKLTEELAEPAAVGDLDALRARLDALRPIAQERRAIADAERAAAKEAALKVRTEIVEAAERISGTDPERIQWRPAGEQLRVLLEQWKESQRTGPRLDRPIEESLWKRFSHARTTFDRERRHFFAELEQRNSQAKTVKEGLVAQAEALSSSTDWAATAGAYRDLMTAWKGAGRASRHDDDALWARFRAAQDTFFAARDNAATVTDAEFRANLDVKEALLVEAERLVPVTDLGAAKRALRTIQDKWDAAGKVPRGDLQRIEARLRAVETAIREADQAVWTRSNPETRARAEGAAAQLQAAISGLEADLAKAKASGNARKTAEAQAALDARRSWLEQVERAARES
jgi:uncharacterized protein DUF349